jgi:hypothetical protein
MMTMVHEFLNAFLFDYESCKLVHQPPECDSDEFDLNEFLMKTLQKHDLCDGRSTILVWKI